MQCFRGGWRLTRAKSIHCNGCAERFNGITSTLWEQIAARKQTYHHRHTDRHPHDRTKQLKPRNFISLYRMSLSDKSGPKSMHALCRHRFSNQHIPQQAPPKQRWGASEMNTTMSRYTDVQFLTGEQILDAEMVKFTLREDVLLFYFSLISSVSKLRTYFFGSRGLLLSRKH